MEVRLDEEVAATPVIRHLRSVTARPENPALVAHVNLHGPLDHSSSAREGKRVRVRGGHGCVSIRRCAEVADAEVRELVRVLPPVGGPAARMLREPAL